VEQLREEDNIRLLHTLTFCRGLLLSQKASILGLSQRCSKLPFDTIRAREVGRVSPSPRGAAKRTLSLTIVTLLVNWPRSIFEDSQTRRSGWQYGLPFFRTILNRYRDARGRQVKESSPNCLQLHTDQLSVFACVLSSQSTFRKNSC